MSLRALKFVPYFQSDIDVSTSFSNQANYNIVKFLININFMYFQPRAGFDVTSSFPTNGSGKC